MVVLTNNPLIRPVHAFFTFVGESALIGVEAVARLFIGRFEREEFVEQMAFIGVSSVPIVALTGFFSGGVFALYLSNFLVKYGATQFVGGTIGLTISREVAPVLAGIMVAARCGSAMAAQIASMKVTEQIDALKMLSVNPSNYLVIPRVLACLTMLPVLGLVCGYSGVIGGWLVSVMNHVNSETFLESIKIYLQPQDIIKGVAKTPIFGVIIAIVSCQQGLRTTEGAVGVGKATTNAVVISMILIYVSNFVLAQVMFN